MKQLTTNWAAQDAGAAPIAAANGRRGSHSRSIRSTPEESRELIRLLCKTRLFLKYTRAFSAASGMPLNLRSIDSLQMPANGHSHENPFCRMMAASRKGCVACLQAQGALESGAARRTRSIICPAGLRETLVPLRVGQTTIAYLQTGQSAAAAITPQQSAKVASELLERGIELDREAASAALQSSPVVSEERFAGYVAMLESFAESLGAVANALLLGERRSDSIPVTKAKRLAEQNFSEKTTLSAAAHAAGLSQSRFCALFRKETGLSFVSYLQRLRVEKAKALLRETPLRAGEIGYSVGFESLAQFNRCFKKVAGQTPTRYRSASTA